MQFWKKKDNLIIAGCVGLFFVMLLFCHDLSCVRAAFPGGGSPALHVSFLDKSGKPHTLAEFKGKPVIVNFWATWCPSCVQEMDSMNAFAKKFAAKGGRLVAISEDNGGSLTVQGFYTRHGYNNLPVYLDNNGALSSAFAASGLPTSILIDARGNEVARFSGAIDWEGPKMQELVRKHFGMKLDFSAK